MSSLGRDCVCVKEVEDEHCFFSKKEGERGEEGQEREDVPLGLCALALRLLLVLLLVAKEEEEETRVTTMATTTRRRTRWRCLKAICPLLLPLLLLVLLVRGVRIILTLTTSLAKIFSLASCVCDRPPASRLLSVLAEDEIVTLVSERRPMDVGLRGRRGRRGSGAGALSHGNMALAHLCIACSLRLCLLPASTKSVGKARR